MLLLFAQWLPYLNFLTLCLGIVAVIGTAYQQQGTHQQVIWYTHYGIFYSVYIDENEML